MAEQMTSNSNPSVDVAGKSSADILGMIQGGNQVQSPQPEPATTPQTPNANVAPKVDQTKEPIKPEEVKQDGLPVPDKFKNPDGTLDVNRLLTSYLEAEKGLSKTANEVHTNKTELEMYRQMAQDFKAQLDELKNKPAVGSEPEAEYTEEEIKLIQENPKAWLKQELAKELQTREQKSAQEQMKQREQDYMMLTAINKARETLPAFGALEQEIKQMANEEWVGDDPKAIETLYYAAVGRKNQDLVNYAVAQARKEAYEQAKKDIQMQVDGGGRDSAPLDASPNLESARLASTEELSKMLPRSRQDY